MKAGYVYAPYIMVQGGVTVSGDYKSMMKGGKNLNYAAYTTMRLSKFSHKQKLEDILSRI